MNQTLLRKSKTLPQTYTVQHKEQMKEKLLETLELKWKLGKREILVGIRIDNNDESLETWIKQELLPALDSSHIRTIVIGENNSKTKYKHVHFVPAKYSKNVMEGCDLFVWPDSDEEASVMHYGTLCITKESHTVDNYNPQHETGNGFVCPLQNPWMLFACVVGAQVHYSFPYDWKHICQNAMDRSYKG